MAESQDKGGGISWKELLIDKGIDVVIIPIGLFAALWFQGWVDERKERSDYGDLLGDFQTELATNADKVKELEEDIGPIAEQDLEKVLGPMRARIELVSESTARMSRVFDCLDSYIEISLKAPRLPAKPGAVAAPAAEPAADDGGDIDVSALSDEDKAELADCSQVLDENKKETTKQFAGVDLSPFYRYEVWQVYLSNGIKLFKDVEAKRLGLKLGEFYASAHEVERRVQEIESLYNDALMKSSGQIAALVSESQDLLPDDPTPDDLRETQPRLLEMSSEALEVKYEIANASNVLSLKVLRLKEFMGAMSDKLTSLRKDLATELARVAGG